LNLGGSSPGFKPQHLQATFAPRVAEKEQVIPSQKQCTFYEKKFARCTLKRFRAPCPLPPWGLGGLEH